MSALTEVLDRLRRDVRWAEPATGRMEVFDSDTTKWIYGPHMGTREDAPEELPESGYLVRFNGEDFELDKGMREEAFLVEVAGIAQDLIQTEIGESWPELADGGVLTVGLDSQGRGAWFADGHSVCEIGALAQLGEDDEDGDEED